MPGRSRKPAPPALTLESALAARSARPDGAPREAGERSPLRARGLSAGLLLLLAIGLVPAMLATAWYLKDSRQAALMDSFRQADIVAVGTSERLRWLMQDAEATLSALAMRPQVRAMDPGRCDPVFGDFSAVNPSFTALTLRRPDASLVCSAMPRPPAPTTVMASPWFQAARSAIGLRASDVHRDPVDDRWTVRLTYPVRGTEAPAAGVLVVPVDLEEMSRRLFSSLPPGSVVAIVDGTNRVVVRSELQAERVGKPAPDAVAAQIDELRRGRPPGDAGLSTSRQFIETGVGGVRRLFVLRTVPMTDWVIASTLPEAETLAAYVTSRNRSLAAFAVLLLCAGLAAWRVTRGILVPIRGLEAAARGMAAGDTTTRAAESGPEAGPREIRQLAREFNSMVDATLAASQQLQASEAHYRTLVQNLPVAFVSHRADSAIELFNDRACTLLRMTPDQMRGRRALDRAWYFIDPDGQRIDPSDYPVSQVLRSGLPMPARTLGLVSEGEGGALAPGAGPDAAHTWVLVTGYPQFDEHGQLERAVIAFIDVTTEHRSEQMRVAMEAAEAASQAKSAFLSRVSHELRTPLNAINGFSELMLTDDRLLPEFRIKLGHVLNAGRHLLSLIEQVLDLSRLDAGGARLTVQPVCLGPLLQECLALCEPLAHSLGVTLSMRPAAADQSAATWVSGDATRLRQVFINLLSNGIKYNRSGGRVDIDLRVAARPGHLPDVVVEVSDDGAGLTEEQIGQLFQPFNRLGAEARGIEGYGLGLLISRTLAQGMGGDITVRSAPGQGACFAVRLAGAAAPPDAGPASPAAGPAALPVTAADEAPSRPLRVLYIEDNELNMLLIRHIVSLRPGLEFFEATDGLAGVRAVADLQPDLVLVDIGLPLLDGFGVVRRIQADPLTAGTTCWALTADTTAETAEQARAAGFDRCMTKPVSLDTMLAALDDWAAQHRQHDATPV